MRPRSVLSGPPSTTNFSPPLSTSTPVARPSVMMTRWVVQSPLMVRLSLCLDIDRYPTFVLHRMPFGLLKGVGPMPVTSGWFWSGPSGNPAALAAL